MHPPAVLAPTFGASKWRFNSQRMTDNRLDSPLKGGHFSHSVQNDLLNAPPVVLAPTLVKRLAGSSLSDASLCIVTRQSYVTNTPDGVRSKHGIFEQLLTVPSRAFARP